jgi:heat shock protein HslJ
MKNTITILLILVALSGIGLAACTGQPDAIALEDTTWVLESYGEQGNLQAVLEDTEITAVFDSAEAKVSGSAGCNNYFASYAIDNNELSIIPPIGSTQMYCEGFMDQENQYLAILEGAETFQVQDSQLRVSSSGNRVLIFNAQ